MQHVSIFRDYPYKMADPFEDILMANERFLLCTICSSLANEADLKQYFGCQYDCSKVHPAIK